MNPENVFMGNALVMFDGEGKGVVGLYTVNRVVVAEDRDRAEQAFTAHLNALPDFRMIREMYVAPAVVAV